MDQTGQFQQITLAQQQQMMQAIPKPGAQMYGIQPGYPDPSYQTLPYDPSQQQPEMHYTTVSPQQAGMMEQQAATQNVFPTPPMQQQQPARIEESSPEAYSPESYQQQDLADLLGTLKVDEAGTGQYLGDLSATMSFSVNMFVQPPTCAIRRLSGERSPSSRTTTRK